MTFDESQTCCGKTPSKKRMRTTHTHGVHILTFQSFQSKDPSQHDSSLRTQSLPLNGSTSATYIRVATFTKETTQDACVALSNVWSMTSIDVSLAQKAFSLLDRPALRYQGLHTGAGPPSLLVGPVWWSGEPGGETETTWGALLEACRPRKWLSRGPLERLLDRKETAS